MHNFWLWGLDPIDIGGEATRSWTLFDWAFWVGTLRYGYVPCDARMEGRWGIYDRKLDTPPYSASSGSHLGSSAIHMQMTGGADLVGALNSGGAVRTVGILKNFLFLDFRSYSRAYKYLVILASFITCADATLTNIGSMCVRDVPIGTEPPAKIKALWGISVGVVAIIMAAYGGGAQGVDGVKALAAAAGFVVLFVFAVQVIAFIKVFFVDKITE